FARGVGLVKDLFCIAAAYDDGADMAVGCRQYDDRFAGLGRGEQRKRDQRCYREDCHQCFGSSTCTTNSVPRTPMIAVGVCTRIASGDCLTILPETTASVPLESVLSNSPAFVVVLNT